MPTASYDTMLHFHTVQSVEDEETLLKKIIDLETKIRAQAETSFINYLQ